MGSFDENEPSFLSSKWFRVRPRAGESCRWESTDGHWVAMAAGSGDELGYAFVTASDGRRERAESFEHALQLAKEWRRAE